MAINYDDLFAALGELVERDAEFVAVFTTLDDAKNEIRDEYELTGVQDLLAGVPQQFASMKGQVQGWRTYMRTLASARITDKATIRDELVLTSTNVSDVLRAIYKDMVGAAESILENSCALGAVTETKQNANAGSLLRTLLLDATSPGAGYIANPEYAGATSELTYNETFTVTCVADDESDRTGEGKELFQVVGGENVPEFSWDVAGSGPSGTFKPLNSFTIIRNLEWESFSGNTPANWTIDTGTAGTHILAESTTVHRGSKALELIGDGALAAIQLSQEPAQTLTPRRLYCLTVWVQGNGSLAAGDLTIQFEGTGYTAGATEKIEMDTAALVAQTAYGLESFFVLMPDEIPDDFALVVKLTGTPSAHSIFIDGMAFGPVYYHGGMGFAVTAGSEKFLRYDKFSFDATNDEAGLFQTWFRDAYKVQMPSSAVPTQDEALADD